MNEVVETLVATAIDEIGRHERGPAGVALWSLFAMYRHERDGFTDTFSEGEVQRYLGSATAVPRLSAEDLAEILATIDRATGSVAHGRAYLAALLRRAEEPRLSTLLLDLLTRMWDDAPTEAQAAVSACRYANDGEELRDTLARWAERDDVAGDEARDVIGELTSTPLDFASFDDLVNVAIHDVGLGAATAAPVHALNRVLCAAARDVPGRRRDARRIRSELRDVYGPAVAALRPSPEAVREAFARLEAETPRTRRAARALVAVVSGIGSQIAVPHLVAVLARFESLDERDRSAALPIVMDLLPLRDLPDVSMALSRWRDIVESLDHTAQASPRP